MTPCSCADSSASAICRAIASASSSGIGSAREALGQILPFHQLHDQRARRAALFQPVEMRDVGVVERGEDFSFALKASEPIGIAGEMLRQNLQGNVALQPGVAGAIHLAHATDAQSSEDFIRPQMFTGQRHTVAALYGTGPSARSDTVLGYDLST